METLKFILKRLAKSGISFSIADAITGNITLTPKEVIEYIKDEDLFFAKIYNVTKEHYLEWKKWANDEENTCRAITKKGTRCKNLTEAHSRGILVEPKYFQPGITDYCFLHQNQPCNTDDTVIYTEKTQLDDFNASLNTAIKENSNTETTEIQNQKNNEGDQQELELLRQRFLRLPQDQAIELIKENQIYYNHLLLSNADMSQNDKDILYEDFKSDILNMVIYKGLLKRMLK